MWSTWCIHITHITYVFLSAIMCARARAYDYLNTYGTSYEYPDIDGIRVSRLKYIKPWMKEGYERMNEPSGEQSRVSRRAWAKARARASAKALRVSTCASGLTINLTWMCHFDKFKSLFLCFSLQNCTITFQFFPLFSKYRRYTCN